MASTILLFGLTLDLGSRLCPPPHARGDETAVVAAVYVSGSVEMAATSSSNMRVRALGGAPRSGGVSKGLGRNQAGEELVLEASLS